MVNYVDVNNACLYSQYQTFPYARINHRTIKEFINSLSLVYEKSKHFICNTERTVLT